jgi:hypothetical protein
VAYTLDIGGVEIGDVGIHEILDYVSAFELERFENAQFVEERELLSLLENEVKQEREARRKYKRQQLELERMQESESSATSSDDVAEPRYTSPQPVGKHGRARPTYKHLYLQPDKVRRRRKRDPETGELLPLSPEAKVEVKPKSSTVHGDALPAVPGYVPDLNKRPRRRRHPVTNELMPLGWVYDPAAEEPNISSGKFQDLSIRGEPDSKRPRLYGSVPTTREIGESLPSRSQRTVPTIIVDSAGSHVTSDTLRAKRRQSDETQRVPVINISDSDVEAKDATGKALRHSPKKSTMQPHAQSRTSLTRPNVCLDGNDSEASSDQGITVSPFQKTKASSITDRSKNQRKTSMLHPTMTPGPQEVSDAESEDGDGEFVIEGILSHRMSDPRTHLPEFGHKPIRLYQVKWEGYEELTWEPIESFPDRSIVQEYHQRVGLKYNDPSSTNRKQSFEANTATVPGRLDTSHNRQVPVIDEVMQDSHPKQEADDSPLTPKDEYVVEAILDHRKSDPRTHPSGSGDKRPVMLYQVKWEGYDEPTWEPIESFPARSIVLEYRERNGLHHPENSNSSKIKSSTPEHPLSKPADGMSASAFKALSSAVKAPALASKPPISQLEQQKEKQRLKWDALIAASKTSGKSTRQEANHDGDSSDE